MTYGIDSLRCYANGAVKLSLHFSLSFPLSLTKNKTIGSHLKYREMVTNNSAIPDKASKQPLLITTAIYFLHATYAPSSDSPVIHCSVRE